MNKKLLNEAKIKRAERTTFNTSDYKLNIRDFVVKISGYPPCVYGKLMPNKVIHDVGPPLRSTDKDLLSNRGDLHVNREDFFEKKTTFLNKNGKYSITNIRDWQDFNYFILCFIDLDYNPSFFCVPKEVVTNNPILRLSAMNDDKETNKHNKYVGKRVSFPSYDVNYIFKKHNILKGTSYKDLLLFFKTFKTKN